MTPLRSFTFAAISAALAAACAGAPLPQARITSSESAIRNAADAGAETVPQATVHMRLAQEQRAKAMTLVSNGEHDRASHMLARAEADAELASALARQARAESDAKRANDSVQEMTP